MNLYDYIINTRDTMLAVKDELYQSSSIYIPFVLKFKLLFHINDYLNSKILLTKMPNNQTLLEYVIENDEGFELLTHLSVDSLEIAEILYKKGKFKLLAESSFDILFIEIDQGKTVLDV